MPPADPEIEMRLLGIAFIFAALVAAGMAAQTHEATGWVLSFLFGCAAAFLLFSPSKRLQ
jgi:hypothetical protein